MVLCEAVQVGYCAAELKGCVLRYTGGSVWGCSGRVLYCRVKGLCVALYIMSLTFVCIANYNTRATTVLRSSKQFVVEKFLAFLWTPRSFTKRSVTRLSRATFIEPHIRVLFLL